MNRQFCISVITVLLGFTTMPGSAQEEVYITRNGDIRVNTVFRDSDLTISGKELQVNLNYETADITMKLDISTLRSVDPFIDSLLQLQRGVLITFQGRLGIDYVNTKSHPPQDFEVEGYLQPAQVQIRGRGHLEHLFEGNFYACLLDMSFYLENSALLKPGNVDGMGDFTHIDIIHTVLKRSNE
ncbi:MAG: hypothetical protein ACE5DN_01960 [Flavobacteriales bacterium]